MNTRNIHKTLKTQKPLYSTYCILVIVIEMENKENLTQIELKNHKMTEIIKGHGIFKNGQLITPKKSLWEA